MSLLRLVINNIRKSVNHCRHFNSATMGDEHVIKEGLSVIKTKGKVFYNPVQEFNRDLSISVLTAFSKNYQIDRLSNKGQGINEEGNDFTSFSTDNFAAGTKCEEGITILEAFSATGMRSIRYAKEIPGLKQIVANDISVKAVEDMKSNIIDNKVEDLVTASEKDATMLMYESRKSQFNVIDLDPYGSPSIFLDSAVQAVKDGGMLLVTATDMAVLAGNSAETCYSKYGAISLRIKSCHEMALRILLQCIESHANRYGRYIVPLMSLSADFYIRVFVQVYTSPKICKSTTSKLSMVYHCNGCDSFTLQPLGVLRIEGKHTKYGLPKGPPVGEKCAHCGVGHTLGGPIWSAPLHCQDFVHQVLQEAPIHLKTYKRIQGVLNVMLEELPEVPLYYTLERLSGTLHVETPSLVVVRSAILNAGYEVSYAHMHKNAIKTNAPSRVIWDIMRCWAELRPVSEKRLKENGPAAHILSIKPEQQYSFDIHIEAKPASKIKGLSRFQENPLPHWGPGTRSTAMIGNIKNLKSIKKQGKRKRQDTSPETNIDCAS